VIGTSFRDCTRGAGVRLLLQKLPSGEAASADCDTALVAEFHEATYHIQLVRKITSMAAETVLHSTQSRGLPRSTLREGERKGQIYSRSLRSGAGEPRKCSGEIEGYEAPGKTSSMDIKGMSTPVQPDSTTFEDSTTKIPQHSSVYCRAGARAQVQDLFLWRLLRSDNTLCIPSNTALLAQLVARGSDNVKVISSSPAERSKR